MHINYLLIRVYICHAGDGPHPCIQAPWNQCLKPVAVPVPLLLLIGIDAVKLHQSDA